MVRPNLEVADIFRRHGEAWRTANAGHLNLTQRRVMTAIEICRTAALGGHVVAEGGQVFGKGREPAGGVDDDVRRPADL